VVCHFDHAQEIETMPRWFTQSIEVDNLLAIHWGVPPIVFGTKIALGLHPLGDPLELAHAVNEVGS
jgi:hypothetical protein